MAKGKKAGGGDKKIPTTPSGTGNSKKNAPKAPKAPPTPQEQRAQALADQRAAERRANRQSRAAENRAVQRDKNSKKRAGKRYLTQADNLQAQIDALGTAIKTSFGKNRDIHLGNIDSNLEQQLQLLREGHAERAAQFVESGKDTAKATGSVLEQGFSNLVRERQDAMTNILEQGAGETDAARSLLMSARNWHANATEGNRNFFDTMRSINQGITDLNVDTRSAMHNAHWTAEGERSRVWQDFYNKKSEAQQQKGNALGQQADYYANAKEMGVKPKKGAEKKSTRKMKNSYNNAAETAGRGYTQRDPSAAIQDWDGQTQLEAKQSNTNLAAALKLGPVARAEGSSLRKWA